MTPEMWEELKTWGDTQRENRRDVNVSGAFCQMINKMTEIERRTLPERVAKILRESNYQSWFHLAEKGKCYTEESFKQITKAIARVLESGDTSEIEKWVKE